MEGGVTLRERKSPYRPRKLSKPSLKNFNPVYDKILKTLREVRASNPNDIEKAVRNCPVSDEVFNTPRALSALETIMMDETDWYDQHIAAVFTSLYMHKSGVELTNRQRILFELILGRTEELERDLKHVGEEGGIILVDLLLNENNLYSGLAASKALENAELACEDLERLAKLLLIDGVGDDLIEDLVKDVYDNKDNFMRLVPYLAERLAEDEDIEDLVMEIGGPMVFSLVRTLNSEDCKNPRHIIQVLGEIGEPGALPTLKNLDTRENEVLKLAVDKAIEKIESRTT